MSAAASEGEEGRGGESGEGGEGEPSSSSDAALLARLCDGDEAALVALYRRHGGRLLAFARREGVADPISAVEDVFVLACRHAHCFDAARVDVATWLVLLAARHFGHRFGDSAPS